MIEYITLQSPLSVINGVPASMAGEWPGIKPNKFPKTKRIIHTIRKSFSNEKPKKNNFSNSKKRRRKFYKAKKQKNMLGDIPK